MTRRPKVWEPRAESVVEEMPSWQVEWEDGVGYEQTRTIVGLLRPLRAPHAWDAHQQVKGAPAFGSCRVRRVEPLKVHPAPGLRPPSY